MYYSKRIDGRMVLRLAQQPSRTLVMEKGQGPPQDLVSNKNSGQHLQNYQTQRGIAEVRKRVSLHSLTIISPVFAEHMASHRDLS